MTARPRPSLAALALIAATATAFAAPPSDMPPSGHRPPMMAPGHEPPPIPPGVVLTEAQHDKIFEIMHAQAPARHAREKELAQALDGLRKLALADEFDDIKAKALADAAARAQAELALTRARTDYKIQRLLTTEQRKQAQAPRPRDGEHCGEPPRR